VSLSLAMAHFKKGVVAGDGELLTAGNNESGQLGVKQDVSLGSVVRVQALEALGAWATAVGQSHLLATTKRRSLLSWGTSEFGQLGMSCHPTLENVIRNLCSQRSKAFSWF
jgi:alpha-tubulin suppressor-like RCC1 family protein